MCLRCLLKSCRILCMCEGTLSIVIVRPLIYQKKKRFDGRYSKFEYCMKMIVTENVTVVGVGRLLAPGVQDKNPHNCLY